VQKRFATFSLKALQAVFSFLALFFEMQIQYDEDLWLLILLYNAHYLILLLLMFPVMIGLHLLYVYQAVHVPVRRLPETQVRLVTQSPDEKYNCSFLHGYCIMRPH